MSVQEKEELESQLDRMKKQIACKLDSAFFDDEIDDLKAMITVLSEVSAGNNKESMEKIKTQ